MEEAEDERVESDAMDTKEMMQISEMDVYKIGSMYYLICSPSDIFILNDDDNYSRKLTIEEIEDLEVRLIWVGQPVKTKYESNDEKAASALIKIIDDFTKMVPKEEFHGFPLASIVSHLRAFLYEVILEEQKFFATTITLSGEQRSTGKKCSIFSCQICMQLQMQIFMIRIS